ncbi:MAG: SpoIIE family protein phosphatase [Geobacteraceae bacterium]|nr:SpoIIE family protein phosphatase [Geobacteraceae bacterium]
MEQPQHAIPRLREIIRPVTGIDSEITVKEVYDIFQKEQALLALPVTCAGRFLGVVNRRTLIFRHLGRPFAMELYGKKPIRTLMEDDSVAMGPALDVHEAMAGLLATDPALETDSFAVVEEGRCLGIVAVSELMMKISESQALLLATLRSLSARIGEEVAKASKIQQDLLPPPESRSGGITISAGVTTSSEIGGDFYDYFSLGDGKLGLVVADVSGHGVQSGMVTTAAKASLHTLISRGVTTPAELLFGMNNAILATARQTLLMTCLVVVIDPQRGEVTLANAGHNFPYLYRKEGGRAEMLENVSSYPLGFEQDCSYQEFTSGFSSGDIIFLYTDGIVECRNREGDEFGYGRLEAFLQENITSPPSTVRQLLLATAEQFTGEKTFEDDVTLLIAASSECCAESPACL